MLLCHREIKEEWNQGNFSGEMGYALMDAQLLVNLNLTKDR